MPLDVIIFSVAFLVILGMLRLNRNSEIAHSTDRNTLIKLRKTRGVSLDEKTVSLAPKLSAAPVPTKTPKPVISREFLNFELKNTNEKNHANALIESVNQLHRPTSMVLSLTRTMTDPKALFDAVRGDPELVAKIINSVNSPLFGLRKPIKTINRAVIFLGVNQVKNIALQFVMAHTLKFAHTEQEKAYKLIGEASFVASSLAFVFAKEMSLDDSAELSTLCLLSYLGDIALVSVEPKMAKYYTNKSCSFKRTQTIQRRLHTNSSQMSEVLALKWGLPDDICQYMANNLAPMNDSLDSLALSAHQQRNLVFCYYVCRLADWIIFERHSDIHNIDQLNFDSVRELGFYYAKSHLSQTHLTAMHRVLQSPTFHNKAADICDHLKH